MVLGFEAELGRVGAETALRAPAAQLDVAGFIRADTAASRMLTDLARWAALPRRVLSLPCSYAQTAAEGDLIEYIALGADPGDGILARITGISTDGGWPTLTAEEIPAP